LACAPVRYITVTGPGPICRNLPIPADTYSTELYRGLAFRAVRLAAAHYCDLGFEHIGDIV
jgi:hypothetical protein